jgi:hypothetical protein
MVAVSLVPSCQSKKAPEQSSSVTVPVGKSEFNSLYNFIKKEGRDDWPADDSYFDGSSLSEYRFYDTEDKLHAVQIMNEGVIMAAVIYKNTDKPGHALAYMITDNDVRIMDMPGSVFTEQEAKEIMKKDYKDLLRMATQ